MDVKRTLSLSLLALAGCSADPQPHAAPVEATTSPATVTAGADRPGLLAQLQSDPAVRREMIFRVRPRGLFQCGARVLGREDHKVYLWLACADFSRGPDAEALSGSSLAAVVTLDDQRNVVRVRFPRQATLQEDIRAMFPADLQDRVIAGRMEVRPSWDELLERARQDA
jgi:hypothetical protein